MKRRSFIQRLGKAALAFSVAPGVFRAIPAARNVRAVVVAPSVGHITRATIATLTPEQIDAIFSTLAVRYIDDYVDPYFKARLDAAKQNV